jgi:hypothetical protein
MRPTPAWKVFALALAGVLLVQLAWMLAVPPFRGLDEHEHALRADSVAHRNLTAITDKRSGMTDAVDADADLVAASTPVCEAFPDGIAVNCDPLGPVIDGRVLMRSSAASYHPLFYLAIGWPSVPFEGYAQLYAMRMVAALLCALSVAAAFVAARRSGGTWLGWGLLLALTPTTTYSMMVAAPNGLELAAAALVWCSLLALPGTYAGRGERGLLALAGTGATILCATRTLGPLWTLLIAGTCVALLGIRPYLHALRRHPWLGGVVLLATAATALWSAHWTLSQGTNDPTGLDDEFPAPALLRVIAQPALWVAQAMGAFPARDELARPGVLAAMVTAYWIFLAVSWRLAHRRGRLVLLLLVFVSVAVPMAVSLATHAQLGFSWQGRYGWPYTMGLPLVGGLLLDRGGWLGSTRSARVLRLGILVALAGATVASQVRVLHQQVANSPLSSTDDWVRTSALGLALITLVGLAFLARAASATVTGPRPPANDATTDDADNLVG